MTKGLPPQVLETKPGYFYVRAKGKYARIKSEPGTEEFVAEAARALSFLLSGKHPHDADLAAFIKNARNCRGKKLMPELLRAARTRARNRGMEFSLTEDWPERQMKAQGGLCAVSGHPMTHNGKKHEPWAPSIDRIVPSEGYTEANCQLVSYIANCAKNQFSDADLKRFCEGVLWLSRKKNGTNTEQERDTFDA